MLDEDGSVVTENHIYCRQMQALAGCFEHTLIVCPFTQKQKDSVTSAYNLKTIDFIQLPNVGGSRIKDKIELVKTIPTWVSAFDKANKQADIIYLRMPNNLNIPGGLYFYFKKAKTFATYTGTWSNYKNEPLTYRFQKWMLKHLFNGPVWVYKDEEKKEKNIFKSYSPSFSESEWNEESIQVAERVRRYKNASITKPVFVTVGALVPNKNQQYVLETCKCLKAKGFSFTWYIVGDGTLKKEYEQFVSENSLQHCVIITGKKTYTELRAIYRSANFLVQPTLVEGFGKAPVEAMAHGVIPVLNKVAMANEMTGNGKRGYIFDATDQSSLQEIILKALGEQHLFGSMIENGRQYVKLQTLENWVNDFIYRINVFYSN